MSRPRDRAPGDEEEFARAVRDVAPLAERARVEPPKVVASRVEESGVVTPFDVTRQGEAIEGRVVGLDRRLVRTLRSEKPDESLDLHGMSTEEARVSLERAVRAAMASGRRRLLVVHGRGHHSNDGVAVLKEAVVQLLTTAPLGPHVLAFASAPNRLGGTGALLVLLRARR